ncbi:hypothetical protein BGX27_010924 [Mortierella sp. AM989]|nr:hypothetical protein BGX27_010924 [Mortierella sp. AM989]
MTLEQRVEHMLFWCDPERWDEGFQKADAIFFELFEGFNLEEEMKIGFTDHDEKVQTLLDCDNKEVHVAEENVDNICDQYNLEPDNMTLPDCNSQDMITVIDNMIEYEQETSVMISIRLLPMGLA